MRRAWAFALVFVLLAGLLAGVASADGHKRRGGGTLGDLVPLAPPARPEEQAATEQPAPQATPAPEDDDEKAPTGPPPDDRALGDLIPSLGSGRDAEEGEAPRRALPRGAAAASEAPAVGALVTLAALGAVLLAGAAWLAARSRRPKAAKPPRKTFEHGRRLGRMVAARDDAAARRALAQAPVGELVRMAGQGELVDVVLARRKGQPCAQAAGYLTGLFERAWADEVSVEHHECAGEKGGSCRYVVRRASGSGGRAAPASTPGSAPWPRRSPPARPGGG